MSWNAPNDAATDARVRFLTDRTWDRLLRLRLVETFQLRPGREVQARTKAINHLKHLVVSAPTVLRDQLRGLSTHELVRRCARLHVMTHHTAERRATVLALRANARRILTLEEEAAVLYAELELLVRRVAPALLGEPGVGVIGAATILNAWSHPGRMRSEAAFAALASVAPLPASSGERIRHRLNPHGDRQLNWPCTWPSCRA